MWRAQHALAKIRTAARHLLTCNEKDDMRTSEGQLFSTKVATPFWNDQSSKALLWQTEVLECQSLVICHMLLRAQTDLHTSSFQRNALAQSQATKACHRVSATCMVSVVATQQASAAAAAPPRTALSAEQVAALTQQIQQLTRWVIELQQRLQASPAAQPQQNQAILTGKELKIERFGGNARHN